MWDDLSGSKRKFQLVGKYETINPGRLNILDIPKYKEWQTMDKWQRAGWGVGRGQPLVNNCQWYANRMIKGLGPQLP